MFKAALLALFALPNAVNAANTTTEVADVEQLLNALAAGGPQRIVLTSDSYYLGSTPMLVNDSDMSIVSVTGSTLYFVPFNDSKIKIRGVTATIENVTVENIIVDGGAACASGSAPGYGILVENAERVVLKNNTVRNHTASGIKVRNSSFVSVDGNMTLQNRVSGIDTVNSPHTRILNNRSIGDGCGGAFSSISINSPYTTCQGNTVTGNNGEGQGINLGHIEDYADASFSVVSENAILSMKSDGIRIARGSQIIVKNNSITELSDDVSTAWKSGRGIVFFQPTGSAHVLRNIYLQSNIILNVAHYGIQSWAQTQVEADLEGYIAGLYVQDNTIENVDGDGLVLPYLAHGRITGNQIARQESVENLDFGIYARYAAYGVIAQNTIRNFGYGLRDSNSQSILVVNNIFDRNLCGRPESRDFYAGVQPDSFRQANIRDHDDPTTRNVVKISDIYVRFNHTPGVLKLETSEGGDPGSVWTPVDRQ